MTSSIVRNVLIYVALERTLKKVRLFADILIDVCVMVVAWMVRTGNISFCLNRLDQGQRDLGTKNES